MRDRTAYVAVELDNGNEPVEGEEALLLLDAVEDASEIEQILALQRGWTEFIDRFPGARIRFLFDFLSPPELRHEYETMLRRSGRKQPHKLLRFLAIEHPDVAALAESLQGENFPWIARVTLYEASFIPTLHPEEDVKPAPTSYGQRPGCSAFADVETQFGVMDEGWLQGSLRGINVLELWNNGIGFGAGIRVADVETNWFTNIPEFDPQIKQHGEIVSDLASNGTHGTKILSVIATEHSHHTVRGVVPGSTLVQLSTKSSSGVNQAEKQSKAIARGITQLDQGDILVLPIGSSFKSVPAECADLVFMAVQSLTSIDRIVVAGGGDASLNLDVYVHEDGTTPLAPGQIDSGAIIVAAATANHLPDGHERVYESCYGSRIDCYAWGQYVWAICGPSSAGASTSLYTSNFTSASSATAIVGAAAASLQSAHVAVKGTRLSAKDIRRHFTDSSLCIAPRARSTIGYMPDLGRIGRHLGLIP